LLDFSDWRTGILEDVLSQIHNYIVEKVAPRPSTSIVADRPKVKKGGKLTKLFKNFRRIAQECIFFAFLNEEESKLIEL
jgi:hypothetical protein